MINAQAERMKKKKYLFFTLSLDEVTHESKHGNICSSWVSPLDVSLDQNISHKAARVSLQFRFFSDRQHQMNTTAHEMLKVDSSEKTQVKDKDIDPSRLLIYKRFIIFIKFLLTWNAFNLKRSHTSLLLISLQIAYSCGP